MTGPDLKPCPVCGGPAHLYRADDVACRDAKCLGYKFRHVTTEQWNRRATDQATLAAPPETLALIAAAYEVAAHWIEAVPQSLPARDEYARHIRRLTPAEAIAAREARDAQMRAEGRVAGLREADGKSLRRVRHVKRGTTYCEIGRGQIQTDRLLSDYADVVVYQCEGDGRFWIRPTDEFDDICRFEKLPPNDPAAKIAGLREAAEQCAKPGTEYERKVAQMKEDFPNGI